MSIFNYGVSTLGNTNPNRENKSYPRIFNKLEIV